MKSSAETRFFQKVVMPKDTSHCWIWMASRRGEGYGQFWFDGRMVPAHRFSYELAKGPIGDGLHIDHLCENPPCVNPDHLEAVTPRVNTLRGNGPAAIHDVKVECDYGHPFSTENTYVNRKGSRVCRQCERRRIAELRARRRKFSSSPQSQAAQAQAHPTRANILQALQESERPLSVSDLATVVGERTGRSRYHLDALCDLGLVHVAEKRLIGRFWTKFYAIVDQAPSFSPRAIRQTFGFDYWDEPQVEVRGPQACEHFYVLAGGRS